MGWCDGEDAAADGWAGNPVTARNFSLESNLSVDAQPLKSDLPGSSRAGESLEEPPLLCCSGTFSGAGGLRKGVLGRGGASATGSPAQTGPLLARLFQQLSPTCVVQAACVGRRL